MFRNSFKCVRLHISIYNVSILSWTLLNRCCTLSSLRLWQLRSVSVCLLVHLVRGVRSGTVEVIAMVNSQRGGHIVSYKRPKIMPLSIFFHMDICICLKHVLSVISWNTSVFSQTPKGEPNFPVLTGFDKLQKSSDPKPRWNGNIY